MATNLESVRSKLIDTTTLARLIANPKEVAKELGLDESDEEAVRGLERIAFTGSKMLRATGEAAGIEMRDTNVGIGMGCCNGAQLRFR